MLFVVSTMLFSIDEATMRVVHGCWEQEKAILIEQACSCSTLFIDG